MILKQEKDNDIVNYTLTRTNASYSVTVQVHNVIVLSIFK